MALTKVKLIADGVITSANLDASHGITTSDIGEGSNLYYTDSRVSSYLSTNGFATQTDIVAAITDSAPVTLDTLNELAAALGDDPNFATTTATSLGLKAPLASPSFTGNATFAGSVTLSQNGTNFEHGYAGNGLVLSHYNIGPSNAIVSGGASNPDTLFINNGGSASDWSNVSITGNVGINETSPASDLVVRADSAGGRGGEITILNYATNTIGNEAALNFGLENSTYAGDAGNAQIKALTTASNAASDMVFSTWNGSSFGERMRISSSGDVLINTNGKFLQGRRSTGSAVIDMIGFGAGTDTLQIKGGTSGGANAISFYDTGGFLGTFYNGNFGIGETSPNGKLDIKQDMTAGTTAAFTSPHLRLSANNTVDNTGFVGMTFATSTANNYGFSWGALRTTSALGGMHLRYHANNVMGTDIFNIDYVGNITIATQRYIRSDSSGGWLTIQGGATYPGGRIDMYGGSNAAAGIEFLTGGTTATPTERMRIDTLGNIKVGTDTPLFLYSEQGVAQVAANRVSSNGNIIDTSSSAAYINLYTPTAGSYITFHTANTINTSPAERMRILSSGGITFNGDTAAANALDDYEEGTWTPDVHGSTTRGTVSYQYRSGSYTKIGNRVWCRFGFKLSSISGATGRVRVDGLPFVSRSYGSYQEPNFSVSTGLLATTANAYRARMFVVNSSSYLEGRISVNTDTIWDISDFGGDEWIILAFHYETHI